MAIKDSFQNESYKLVVKVKFCKLLLLVVISHPIMLWACSDYVNNLPIEEFRKSSIVIVPDIQNYTHLEERFKYLNAIADYCQRNKDEINAIL